jgi:hypothetical protein
MSLKRGSRSCFPIYIMSINNPSETLVFPVSHWSYPYQTPRGRFKLLAVDTGPHGLHLSSIPYPGPRSKQPSDKPRQWLAGSARRNDGSACGYSGPAASGRAATDARSNSRLRCQPQRAVASSETGSVSSNSEIRAAAGALRAVETGMNAGTSGRNCTGKTTLPTVPCGSESRDYLPRPG